MADITVVSREGKIAIENKATFQAYIAEIVDRYKDVIVVDKAEAKKDRATINKLLKNIDERRKDVKREYEGPLKAFEAELRAMTEPLKQAGEAIDAQIKIIEAEERKERRAQIEAEYAKLPTNVPLSEVWDDSWLNVSKSMANVIREMLSALLAAQNTPKTATVIADEGVNQHGVPVFDFSEVSQYTLTITCTEKQMSSITAFLDSLKVFYMEG